MGSLISKPKAPPAPDFSAQQRAANERAIKAQQEQAEQRAELEAAKDAKRKKKGRQSLIATSELGAGGETTG